MHLGYKYGIYNLACLLATLSDRYNLGIALRNKKQSLNILFTGLE